MRRVGFDVQPCGEHVPGRIDNKQDTGDAVTRSDASREQYYPGDRKCDAYKIKGSQGFGGLYCGGGNSCTGSSGGFHDFILFFGQNSTVFR